MNPMTNVRNITKLSDRELKHGDGKTSWHDEYRDSAWIFLGGLPYDLSEGDVIAVFSQYGELVNINLIRDKSTGKSKGFAFLCYENQRSTILAVDNFNGIKILGRTIRVDHVKEYKVPKDNDKVDDLTRQLWTEGCAPTSKFGSGNNPDPEFPDSGEDDSLPPVPASLLALASSSGPGKLLSSNKDKERDKDRKRKHKDSKKSKKSKRSKSSEKKKKKKKHHKKNSRRGSSSSSSDSGGSEASA